MAGRGQRLQGPARARQARAVAHELVRREAAVMPFVELDLGLRQARRRQAEDPGPEGLGQGGGEGGVVEMGVGHQDRRDPFAVQRRHQGLQVGLDVRPRVDHRDLAPAHQIGPGAPEGERPRIGRDDPADPGRDLVGLAVVEGHVADEGDHRGGGPARPGPCQGGRRPDRGSRIMTGELAIFVSKRLQRAVAAIMCLIALQALVTLSSCHPEITPSAAAARVAIGS